MAVDFVMGVESVDWGVLKARLRGDDFDNGRTPEQLRTSFANSFAVCFAWADGEVVGKGRVLSDSVCNAYLVDLWTWTPFRRQGIASEILRRLTEKHPGQHVYLQADDDLVEFYDRLGFSPQPNGLMRVIGQWLVNHPPT